MLLNQAAVSCTESERILWPFSSWRGWFRRCVIAFDLPRLAFVVQQAAEHFLFPESVISDNEQVKVNLEIYYGSFNKLEILSRLQRRGNFCAIYSLGCYLISTKTFPLCLFSSIRDTLQLIVTIAIMISSLK